MKIRLVGAKLLHADGQTNTTKLTVVFCIFPKASGNAVLSKVEMQRTGL
jgi:hypothetical protein